MDIKNKVILIAAVLLVSSCSRYYYVFENIETKEVITIFETGYYRYIVSGKYDYIPDKDFVKLDTRNVSRLQDYINICWNKEHHGWKILSPNAEVIENKLDTTKYKIELKLPVDSRGVPISESLGSSNCSSFNFTESTLMQEMKLTRLLD